ncbi:MAG: FkbM family methyltransferase [Planctomycetota bacterium]
MPDWLVLIWLILLSGVAGGAAYQAQHSKRRLRKLAKRTDFWAKHDRFIRPLQAANETRLRTWQRQNGSEGRPVPALMAGPHGDDVFLLEVLRPFESTTPGRFLECGAYDGLLLSVTWAFESLGWSGVLIEPDPDTGSACEKNRPGCRVVRAAVGAPDGPDAITLRIARGAPMSGLMNYTAGSEILTKEQREADIEDVRVPLTTLDAALDDKLHGRGDGTDTPLDLMVLDVEGNELAALSGFDFDRWKPRALFIEDNSQGADRAVPDLMRDKGYIRAARFLQNDLYLKPDDTDAIQRARLYQVEMPAAVRGTTQREPDAS